MESEEEGECVDPGEEFRNRVLTVFYGDTSRWPDASEQEEDEDEEEDDIDAAAARYMDELERERETIAASTIPRLPPDNGPESLMPQRKKKKASLQDEEYYNEEDAIMEEDDDDDELNSRYTYNAGFESTRTIARITQPIPETTLCRLQCVDSAHVPVVHPDTVKEARAKLSRYKRDRFVPGVKPCKICRYRYVSQNDGERASSKKIQAFHNFYTQHSDSMSEDELYPCMAEYWNKHVATSFVSHRIRDDLCMTASEVEHHYSIDGCTTSPEIIHKSINRELIRLQRHTVQYGLYQMQVDEGQPTNSIQVSQANCTAFLKTADAISKNMQRYVTYSMNAKAEARYGVDEKTLVSGSGPTYSKSMNQHGARMLEKKNRTSSRKIL